jgi:hypothetical protein
MSFLKRAGSVAGVAVALAFAIGCGETVIDSAKTEEQLQASLSKSLGAKVTSVDCPSDVEVKAGATFTCTVEVKGGETQTATLKIRNEDADISVTDLNTSGEGHSGSNE